MKKIKQPHGGAIVNAEKGETANPNGRPKKGISLVNFELEKKGYMPASKADIEANYMAMLQLPRKELVLLGNDESKPILVRIIAKNMLSGKGFEIIEKMLDRGIGKNGFSSGTSFGIGLDAEKKQLIVTVKLPE